MMKALAHLLGVVPHTSPEARRYAFDNPDIPEFYTLLGAIERGFTPPPGWFFTTDRRDVYQSACPNVLVYVQGVLAARFWDSHNPRTASGGRCDILCEDKAFRAELLGILDQAEAFYHGHRDHVPSVRLRTAPPRGEQVFHSVLDAFHGLHKA